MSTSSRRTWLILGLLVVAVGVGVALQRKRSAAADTTPPASPASGAVQPRLQLSTADIWTARTLSMAQAVEVSGPIRAMQTAMVKAKVAGELKSLLVREGDSVRAGQSLGQIDTTELDWRLKQAQQQAQAAKAQVDIAERTLQNNRALVSQGFISPTALDTATATAQGAQASYLAAQSAVELARKALADAQLLAPLSGQISQRLAQPGERVAVDARILEIVDLSRLELEAALPPQAVSGLKPGARALLQVDGVSQPVDAVVARISPATTAGTRTVATYLSIANQAGLRQGLFATGRILAGQSERLAVPTSALRLDRAEPTLLVIEGDVVRARKVRTGSTGEFNGQAMTEILGGLNAGDRVLTAQAGNPRDGTLVVAPAPTGAPASAASAL